MKKHVFTIAAVLLAVGLSAFTVSKGKAHASTTTYWFSVELADIETDQLVSDNDVLFIESNNGSEPTNGCSSGELYCTIGITNPNNVEEDQGQPGVFHIVGSVTPDVTGSTKPQ